MTATAVPSSRPHPLGPLRPPGGRGGLVDVFRRRYLLSLLIRKEVRVRYQGSLVGFAWAYVKPLMRFAMYYFVIGLVLNLRQNVEDFPIHIFCGMVVVHFFTETLNAGTKSVTRNKALVRKIYLPREMFPVASTLVSAYHILPYLVILVIGAFVSGWSPDLPGLAAGVLGLAIIGVFAMAAALVFSALNVFARDVQNFVELIGMIAFWSTPMIYPISRVTEQFGGTWVYALYMSNPLANAALLIQRCFWTTSAEDPAAAARTEMPNLLFTRGFGVLAAGLVLLVFAQLLFTRLEGKFAERL